MGEAACRAANLKSPVSDEPSDHDEFYRSRSDEALRWIVRLNSGEATRAEETAFATWRAADPVNELAAREAEEIWRDAADLNQDRDTGSVLPGRGGGGGPSRRKLLGVAGLLAAGGPGGWAFLAGRDTFADHATGRGETREVALVDGSRVVLNARSAIDVAARRATLRKGEAFFEIASDRAGPFQLSAGSIDVTTDTAAFNVEVSRPDGSVAISVSERRISLSSPLTSSFDLGERRGVIATSNGQIGAARQVDREAATAWRDGKLIAEDRRLDEVAARIARYHRGWIVVRDDVAALRVSAVLDLRTPDTSLDALASALPVAVTRISPFLTIIGRA